MYVSFRIVLLSFRFRHRFSSFGLGEYHPLESESSSLMKPTLLKFPCSIVLMHHFTVVDTAARSLIMSFHGKSILRLTEASICSSAWAVVCPGNLPCIPTRGGSMHRILALPDHLITHCKHERPPEQRQSKEKSPNSDLKTIFSLFARHSYSKG